MAIKIAQKIKTTSKIDIRQKNTPKNVEDPSEVKNYETYNNERKKQVFASNSKFQIKKIQLVSSK